MKPYRHSTRLIIQLGVLALQLVMTQVLTFFGSLSISNMNAFPRNHPVFFVVLLGVTFGVGGFLSCGLALQWRWLNAGPRYRSRLISALMGAYLPLLFALTVYRALEPGTPFFLLSIILSLLGFYAPEWVKGYQSVLPFATLAGVGPHVAITTAYQRRQQVRLNDASVGRWRFHE